MEDVATLPYDMEARFGEEILPSHPCWLWLVRHAAWVNGRFALRADKTTAYEHAFETAYRGAIVRFGEMILYKEPSSAAGQLTGGRRAHKADRQWHRGWWLGKSSTIQHLGGAISKIKLKHKYEIFK